LYFVKLQCQTQVVIMVNTVSGVTTVNLEDHDPTNLYV
jgi:hypothetical protein